MLLIATPAAAKQETPTGIVAVFTGLESAPHLSREQCMANVPSRFRGGCGAGINLSGLLGWDWPTGVAIELLSGAGIKHERGEARPLRIWNTFGAIRLGTRRGVRPFTAVGIGFTTMSYGESGRRSSIALQLSSGIRRRVSRVLATRFEGRLILSDATGALWSVVGGLEWRRERMRE